MNAIGGQICGDLARVSSEEHINWIETGSRTDKAGCNALVIRWRALKAALKVLDEYSALRLVVWAPKIRDSFTLAD